jgi:hypothetical protein
VTPASVATDACIESLEQCFWRDQSVAQLELIPDLVPVDRVLIETKSEPTARTDV